MVVMDSMEEWLLACLTHSNIVFHTNRFSEIDSNLATIFVNPIIRKVAALIIFK